MKIKFISLANLLMGFLCSGIGCSLYHCCNLGSDAFNTLVQGVSSVLNISAGNAFYLSQGILLLVIAIFRRRYIGIGTVFGIFVVGSVMNLLLCFLEPLLQTASIFVRMCFLAIAPAFIGMGIALANRSGLGMVPNDIIPVIVHEKKTQLQFKTVRVFNDIITLIIGAILGGTVGIGTVCSALLTGPCIESAQSLLRLRILNKRTVVD